MKKAKNNYQYEITTRLGSLLVDPLGEADFKIEWDREEDIEFDYPKSLPSKIIFTGEAYRTLLRLEKSIYRCELLGLSIRKPCVVDGQESYALWFSGQFSLNDGNWNISRCEVEIKLDEAAPSKCIEDNKGIDFDLMQHVPNRVTVNTNPPNIVLEKVTYTKSGSSSGLVPVFAWDASSPYGPNPSAVGFIPYYNSYSNNGSTYNILTKWARIVLTLQCSDPIPAPESGWILQGDSCPGLGGTRVYAKGASLYDCNYSYPSVPVGESQVQDCKIVGDTTGITELKNGMSLKDCLESFMAEFCPSLSVKSQFFQINPDTVTDTNYVTLKRSKTKGIVVFQKSDVKRPTAIAATKAITQFEKFIKALCLMYNCNYRVVGNVFRIEHFNWFTSNPGLNLTLPKYAAFVNGMNEYSYATEQIPEREEFQFMEGTFGSDFDTTAIVYTGGCVAKESKDNVKSYPTEIVTTDVQLCISNSSADSKVVEDKGLVFVATDTDGTDTWIISEDGINTENSLNNSMGWPQLLRDYHRYNRPLKTGILNGVDTTFITVKPTKKGKTIRIPLCCDDTFNPDSYVTTEMGQGQVSKAVYSFKDSTLDLDLVYSAYDNLAGNVAPIAINDVRNIYVNQEIIIDVLVNDIDTPGTIRGVVIGTPPMNGTALVLPDMTVKYTPNLGYTGDDYFNYRIFDDWNEYSNTALVAINIYPANTPPIAVDDNYTMNMGTTLTVAAPGVFANDHDDVGFTLSTYMPISASGGTVSLLPNGSFTFTPVNPSFVGFDVFTYTIIDGQGLTDSATVEIQVKNPSFPTAVDDYFVTTINTPMISGISLLANDINPIGGSFTVSASTGPTTEGGSVTRYPDGTFNYFPATGFTGVDTFIYQCVNSAGTSLGTAHIRVLPPIWVKLTKTNDTTIQNPIICNGITVNGGSFKRANFILNFYSDSAGTIPIDVTGFGLIVNINIGARTSPSGSFVYDNDPFDGSTGTQTSYLSNFIYLTNTHGCDNSDPMYYEQNFGLNPGNYTIL